MQNFGWDNPIKIGAVIFEIIYMKFYNFSDSDHTYEAIHAHIQNDFVPPGHSLFLLYKWDLMCVHSDSCYKAIHAYIQSDVPLEVFTIYSIIFFIFK